MDSHQINSQECGIAHICTEQELVTSLGEIFSVRLLQPLRLRLLSVVTADLCAVRVESE